MDKPDEIKVFITNREAKCDDCGENLGRQAWITLQREPLEKELKIQLRRAIRLPAIDEAAVSMTRWLQTGKV